MSDYHMNSQSPRRGSGTPQYSNTPSYRGGDSYPSQDNIDVVSNGGSYRAPLSPSAYSGGGLTPAGPSSHDYGMDVNIEDDGDEPRLAYPHSPQYHSPVGSDASPSRARSPTPPSAAPTKRARRVVVSDDEEEEEVAAAPPPKKKRAKAPKKKRGNNYDHGSSEDDAWENDVEPEAPLSSGEGSEYADSDDGARTKSKKGSKKAAPAKSGKAKQTTKGAAKATKAEPKKGRGSQLKAVLGTPDPTSAPVTQPASAAISRASSPASAAGKTKETSASKRKLPTIKKNKSQGGGTESRPSPLPREPILGAPQPINRKVVDGEKPKDLDLRDPNALKDLLQAIPRTTRREKDERQQECNRLRTEYQKKLRQDYKPSFDLQSQREKIQRFETKFEESQSVIKWPNVLGAKMREMYDQQRSFREPKSPLEEGEAEEGEVPG